jgi:hypothetical protein
MRWDSGGVSRDESQRLLVSARERRATAATIDAGTAVASAVVLATTAGTGSLDRCACELAARLDVRAVEIEGYVRTGDLFGVPLLSRRSLQLLVADLDHVRLLRGPAAGSFTFPTTTSPATATFSRAPMSSRCTISSASSTSRAGMSLFGGRTSATVCSSDSTTPGSLARLR